MKEYFNENERKNHLIITCCQTAIDDMLKTNAPTDEERKALKTAMKKLEEFSASVYGRLGDAYRRKVLRTNQCTSCGSSGVMRLWKTLYRIARSKILRRV